MARVCIDPGHCGRGLDPGAVLGNRLESDDVLRLALAVVPLLTEQGIDVTLTRDSDKSIGIDERCAMANRDRCDYFLSLHRDAALPTAYGISAYVHSRADTKTTQKAQTILDELLAVTPTMNRGVKKGSANPKWTDYGVNTGTNMASCLLELGFVTNAEDNGRFDAHLADYAAALTRALCKVVGVAYTPQVKPEPDDQFQRLLDELQAVLDRYKGADA